MMSLILLLCAGLLPALNQASSNPGACRPFKDIYTDGKDMCERIYGDAFRYVPVGDPEYDISYTMWFFTAENPNDAVTKVRKDMDLHGEYNDTDKCYLASPGVTAHKPRAYAEESSFTECQPWRTNACCEESTVENSSVINNLYGPTYRWDRCGFMSKECERFFVAENCFYECDQNAGLFRRHPPTINGSYNHAQNGSEWEIYKMPIKGDYCDQWFETCRHDFFCGEGNFFSDECDIPETTAPTPAPAELSGGAIAGIVIACLLALGLGICVCFLVKEERRGQPVFGAVNMEDAKPLAREAPAASNTNNQRTGSEENEVVAI